MLDQLFAGGIVDFPRLRNATRATDIGLGIRKPITRLHRAVPALFKPWEYVRDLGTTWKCRRAGIVIRCAFGGSPWWLRLDTDYWRGLMISGEWPEEDSSSDAAVQEATKNADSSMDFLDCGDICCFPMGLSCRVPPALKSSVSYPLPPRFDSSLPLP